jgi:hypothetical protein
MRALIYIWYVIVQKMVVDYRYGSRRDVEEGQPLFADTQSPRTKVPTP